MKKKILGILIVLICVVLLFVEKDSGVSTATSQHTSSASDSAPSPDWSLVENRIAAILENTHKENREAYETAIAKINHAHSTIGYAYSGVDSVVEDLTSFEGSKELAFKGISDILQDSNEQDELIQNSLKYHILNDCIDGKKQVVEALSKLSEDLKQNAVQFENDLGFLLQEYPQLSTTNNNFEKLVNDIGITFELAPNIASQTTWNTIAIGLDGLVLMTNKLVQRFFGEIIGATARRMSLALPFMWADGPLPIADIIVGFLEVGFLAYAVAELDEARNQMRPELRQTLNQSVQEYQKGVIHTGKNNALDLLQQINGQAHNVANNMIAELRYL